MGIVVAFRRRRHARALAFFADAKAGSVISLRPFLAAKSRMTGQRFAGIPRSRQQLTVEGSARDLRAVNSAATTYVPPSPSMIESQVSMADTIVCDLQTCQEFASCKATDLALCAGISGMAEPHNESTEAIAQRLRATREALGFKQQTDFAKALGLHKSSYNLFETAERRITLTVAQRLRRKFGISLDWIYCGDASQLPNSLIKKLGTLAA